MTRYGYQLYMVTQYGPFSLSSDSASELLIYLGYAQQGLPGLTFSYLILWRTADDVVLLTYIS